jgi:hypothetical protein
MLLHTASGTKTFRYEEVKPGQWKLLGEVPTGRGAPRAEAAPAVPSPDRKVD